MALCVRYGHAGRTEISAGDSAGQDAELLTCLLLEVSAERLPSSVERGSPREAKLGDGRGEATGAPQEADFRLRGRSRDARPLAVIARPESSCRDTCRKPASSGGRLLCEGGRSPGPGASRPAHAHTHMCAGSRRETPVDGHPTEGPGLSLPGPGTPAVMENAFLPAPGRCDGTFRCTPGW